MRHHEKALEAEWCWVQMEQCMMGPLTAQISSSQERRNEEGGCLKAPFLSLLACSVVRCLFIHLISKTSGPALLDMALI